MFRAVVGQSENPDSQLAIDEVLAQCEDALNGERPRAGILYCCHDHPHQLVLDQIETSFQGIELIGCSSDGEISTDGFLDGSIVLTLFVSDVVDIKAGVGERLGKDSDSASMVAVESARSRLRGSPVLCLATPESTTVSGDGVLRGLRAALGPEAGIFGGKAADSGAAAKTYQFCRGHVYMDSVPVLLFAEPLKYSVGFDHGWSAIGRRRTVTKAWGSRVLECDDEPMLNMYRHYLGDHSLVSAEYPLAVHEGGTFHLRTPSTYIEREGGIVFSGEIAVSSEVQFAEATRPGLIEATQRAAKEAAEKYPGREPAVAMMFVCAIRKYLLGTQVAQEVATAIETLPADIPCSGFYCFGEFYSPPGRAGAGFHNASVVVVILGAD